MLDSSELFNVKVKDISISSAGVTITVSQGKNDQSREGYRSVTARSIERLHVL